jgi:hypothetical protein
MNKRRVVYISSLKTDRSTTREVSKQHRSMLKKFNEEKKPFRHFAVWNPSTGFIKRKISTRQVFKKFMMLLVEYSFKLSTRESFENL